MSLDKYINSLKTSGSFDSFINTLLISVYDNDDIIKQLTNSKYIKIWESAFSEDGNGGELFGERLYATAVLKLLYGRSKGNLTPSELSNMNIYFNSTSFMNLIVKEIGFDNWSNVESSILFKRFIAALAMISQDIHDQYLRSKDYKMVINCPTESISVQRLVDSILAMLKVDIKLASQISDKTFITQIPDLFGHRGKWGIVSNKDNTIFRFIIYESELVNKIATVVSYSNREYIKTMLNGLNGMENKDELLLAKNINAKFNEIGITRKLIEDYRIATRVDSIQPDSVKKLFINTVKNKGYVSARFEFPDSHSFEVKGSKIGVVLIYGVNSEGYKSLLHVESGEIINDNYTNLKSLAVENFIKAD